MILVFRPAGIMGNGEIGLPKAAAREPHARAAE
jgi:hypothetical protein